jgi:hypothetical protein
MQFCDYDVVEVFHAEYFADGGIRVVHGWLHTEDRIIFIHISIKAYRVTFCRMIVKKPDDCEEAWI